MSASGQNRVTTIALLTLMLCAVATTAAAVRRVFFQGGRVGVGLTRQSADVKNWTQYLAGGHRIGPADAKAVILEFGDFECPVCGAFERGALRAVRARYRNDVAVVYRNWPLPYHKFALPAAKAAECAATQGRFEAMHDALFAKQDSLGLKSFVDFGRDAGVRDLAAFSQCIADTRPVPAIASDTAAALAVEGHGTPTIVIGGVRLGTLPDSARLDSLVRKELGVSER